MKSRFKIAIIGCGSISDRWIRYAYERNDAEIVALADIHKENAQAKLQKFAIGCPVFTDVEEAIQSTGANLVFDITTPENHAQVVKTALQLGCDVMGEKPMAGSMEEAFILIKTAQEANKFYAIMQNRRYIKNARALRALLQGGAIGQVGFLGADFYRELKYGSFREAMKHPLLLDMAIHTFDQARFFTGGDAVSVYCHEYNPPGSGFEGNVSSDCIFEMSDGSVFNYRGSWCVKGSATPWDGHWRITGDKGTAHWDGEKEPYAELDDKLIQANSQWEGKHMHQGCLDEMFAALLESRKAETDCTDNIKSLAMAYGALESAKTGKKVMISDILQHDENRR